MSDDQRHEELDAWFEEVVTENGTRSVDGYLRAHHELDSSFEAPVDSAHNQPLERFLDAWDGGRMKQTVLGPRGDEDWHRLSLEAKQALREAHDVRIRHLAEREHERSGESVVDELSGTLLGGWRLRLPIIIGGVVLFITVIVGANALRDDGTPTTDPMADQTQDDGDVEDAGSDDDPAQDDLPPARPDVEVPLTVDVTVSGDDLCGLAAGLADLGVVLAPGPGPDGGQIGFFGPGGRTDVALTGTVKRGSPSDTWEDRGDGTQVLEDITVADGAITGDLTWTAPDGCTSTFAVSMLVPPDITDWWNQLPPAGPSDCVFVGTLEVVDGRATLVGTLTDLGGNPVEGQALTLEVLGSEPGRTTVGTTSGPDGRVEFSFDAPPGDVSSLSVLVAKGAHNLGSTFATGG